MSYFMAVMTVLDAQISDLNYRRYYYFQSSKGRGLIQHKLPVYYLDLVYRSEVRLSLRSSVSQRDHSKLHGLWCCPGPRDCSVPGDQETERQPGARGDSRARGQLMAEEGETVGATSAAGSAGLLITAGGGEDVTSPQPGPLVIRR